MKRKLPSMKRPPEKNELERGQSTWYYTTDSLVKYTADKKIQARRKTSKYGIDLFNRCTTAIFEKKISLGSQV